MQKSEAKPDTAKCQFRLVTSTLHKCLLACLISFFVLAGIAAFNLATLDLFPPEVSVLSKAISPKYNLQAVLVKKDYRGFMKPTYSVGIVAKGAEYDGSKIDTILFSEGPNDDENAMNLHWEDRVLVITFPNAARFDDKLTSFRAFGKTFKVKYLAPSKPLPYNTIGNKTTRKLLHFDSPRWDPPFRPGLARL